MAPLSTENYQPASPAAGPALTQQRPNSKLRLLVVDDNADAATSLGRLLSLLGHEVRVVYDGTTALAEIEAFGPCAVLLDLGMPGMDGIETAECIRAREGGNQCSLIAVTGWGQDHDRHLTQAAGFAAHLTKPVNLDQLQSVLSSVFAGV